MGEGTRRNCTTTVYVKALKEAVHATRHSTKDLSVLSHTYSPEEMKKADKFHFMKAFPEVTKLAMNS